MLNKIIKAANDVPGDSVPLIPSVSF